MAPSIKLGLLVFAFTLFSAGIVAAAAFLPLERLGRASSITDPSSLSRNAI